MKDTRSREIAPNETAVPAGWPRPHYRIEGSGPKYAQWSSESASAQIMCCSSSRTFTAGAYNLCSCCGQAMERGLVFDREWANANCPPEMREQEVVRALSGDNFLSLRPGRFDRHDTHYGSPLCYRCTVFALKHCPFFGMIHEVYGDALHWVVVTQADQYREFDESAGIEIVAPEAMERVTTAQVVEEVRSGRLHLMDVGADDLPLIKRPVDVYEDDVVESQQPPKYTPAQVRARDVGGSR